ncbi:hypothetical protein A1O1_02351 [Capronia coronata CBS 617.96]|uniref:Uncharacterized protein n=1 Tax=Capronia coronata CBS 617.96 TaxID=1182541 RepID=W9YN44_9EURO|nr:uncharacterized protein A1O1_02351 [Capronia coronata CBS 617.96]EXJ93958.1 hypothetical protein A1O1_02351 [Capronia coronata CBS 617.96]
MINRVSDLLGYLNLLWTPDWKHDLIRLDKFVLPEDPRVIFEESTTQVFNDSAPRYQARYQKWPVYIFNPKVFASLLNKGLLGGGSLAHKVPGNILKRMQLRWTMASKIWSADHDYYQPGVNVPIYRIAGVELEMSRFEKREYQRACPKMQPFYATCRSSSWYFATPRDRIAEAVTRSLTYIYITSEFREQIFTKMTPGNTSWFGTLAGGLQYDLCADAFPPVKISTSTSWYLQH